MRSFCVSNNTCNMPIGRIMSLLLVSVLISIPAFSAVTDIIINEIHYHPDSESEQEEFIELYNRGASSVNLGGWSFVKGISYTFPQGITLAPGQYLVVAKNTRLLSGWVKDVTLLGDYDGFLNDGGEKLTLANAKGEIADSVPFKDEPPWPTAPDGEGPSLERISPNEESQNPANWQEADLPLPSQWFQARVTGVATGNSVQFHLTGPATVWLDDVSLIRSGAAGNLVKNSGFEDVLNSSNDWSLKGNHKSSERFKTAEAHTGAYVLQLVSTGENVDVANNSLAQNTQPVTTNGPQYELSFWVRVIRGEGALIVEQNQYGLLTQFSLRGTKVTPGKPNSVFSANLPPALSNARWDPLSPAPSKSVTVQVYATDTDGVSSVSLLYRTLTLSKQGNEQTTSMKLVAGTLKAGTWSAVLPGQPDRTLVRFRFQATDIRGNRRDLPSQGEARNTYTYFHYADTENSTIPVVFLYDFDGPDSTSTFTGDSVMVIRPPQGKDWQVYDHIAVTTRKGGYNVNFLPHYEYDDMSGINIIFEPKNRYALAEWLCYRVYQSLGALAEKVDHYRLFYNNTARGYYLMFEQPNRHFIGRNGINNEGNLYKIIWNFDHSLTPQNIIRQHQKKTHLYTGYDDVVEMAQTLGTLKPPEQTLYIDSHLAVDLIIDYFVGCQLISDWDGYFNNQFVYHDTEKTGLWYIFPWDKDKTWGDHDSYRLPYYPFYDMPILFGANGTQQSGQDNRTWWRPPGFISGPFLANPDIQKRFLYRLGYAAKHLFIPETWIPIIDDLEKRLEPEIRYKAALLNENPANRLTEFHNDIESFRLQVVNRRQFILKEVESRIGPVAVNDWIRY